MDLCRKSLKVLKAKKTKLERTFAQMVQWKVQGICEKGKVTSTWHPLWQHRNSILLLKSFTVIYFKVCICTDDMPHSRHAVLHMYSLWSLQVKLHFKISEKVELPTLCDHKLRWQTWQEEQSCRKDKKMRRINIFEYHKTIFTVHYWL